MPVNFFDSACQRSIRQKQFGIYDPQDNSPAKIIGFDSDLSNARVTNNTDQPILFTAIDYCVVNLRDNGDMDSHCDAMLNTDTSLFFLELKNKRDSWQEEGLSQIESTLTRMIVEFPEFYYGFKKRKAVVANRKHRFPGFNKINAEQREKFQSKYRMRIQFEADIIIT